MSSHLSAFVPRLHHALVALNAVAWLPACTIRDATSMPNPPSQECVNGAVVVHQPDAVSLDAWQAETFALPPAFAPELPAGAESLRFAPGWRDPSAENFWSYAFVMWIDEPAPDAARIGDLLEK